jgi:hypothetical protein
VTWLPRCAVRLGGWCEIDTAVGSLKAQSSDGGTDARGEVEDPFGDLFPVKRWHAGREDGPRGTRGPWLGQFAIPRSGWSAGG